jgi:hypothetical protein
MKVELPNLGIQSKVQDYTITKSFDDFGVVTEIDSKAKFDSENGFETLIEETFAGSTEEDVLLTIECGDDDIEIDGYILHNEGSINFNNCYAEKTLKFKSPIECIKNKDINIFDYVPYETVTIQGTILYTYYNHSVLIDLEQSKSFTVDQLLGILGGYPDKTSLGFFPEFIDLQCYPNIEVDNDENNYYTGHNVTINVKYIQLYSDVQFSELWRPLSSGGYYYSAIPKLLYDSGVYTDNTYIDILGDSIVETGVKFTAGKLNLYKDIPISNTFSINEIIQDIFSCTGIQIVSNFFGIDSDYTNPDNNEYEFATNYLQALRIAQSYDIIRESALEDSFGKSGLIKAKTLVLEFNKIFGLHLVYDSTIDVIRWEHYTYFESKGIDFAIKEIQYELDDNAEINRELINTETWFMAQPSPTDGFYSTKIDYQNSQLNSEINDVPRKTDTFMTDLFGTLNNETYNQDSYKKLFYLLSTESGKVIGLNSAMSIRNLVENLHYKNRPLKSGLHDNRAVTFTGFSIGIEVNVSFFSTFKLFNKLNPGNTIKLNRAGKGTWLISEMSISDKKIELTVKK